jgi:riboflavin kinase / FMN adenylyltransferase
MRLREKVKVISSYGVDILSVIHFNSTFAALTAQDFVEKVLVDKLRAKYIVVGDDFKFGKGHQGNFPYLQKQAQKFNFTVEEVEAVKLDGRRVSSTWAREALQLGDLATVNMLLGRSYSISGHVAHGDKRGRLLGFPTANVHLYRKQSPLAGVYFVKVHGVKVQRGIANIGYRPTIEGERKKLLEVYLLDFAEDIYGTLIEAEFLYKLRDEKRYASFELLKQQLAEDEKQARSFFAKGCF